ncbi:MAG: Asp-tRNA(Asn)/Glu-tRNA(Gln) amidotransferase GatCAB subunit B [Spirochaetes bacterium]|nr:Asp-tRNA(Asn)/Glu-tRNA(Gln) amidotransferase subunit GatB [Deltaproteobacteria bacterium]RKY02417.1 MAG: Asp-tRNA(Asn)/Glu-tRNA(Gln) amidotransferase GatCAB subunit B [Spirochaetota bacterium]
MEYEPVIGLEVHAQLLTKTKIFCGCPTTFGAEPNKYTCPVCTGMPGALPVLNKQVVEFTIRMALATHCNIAPYSVFARKNYFYPDLPKGYQISQYELPIAEHGYVEIQLNGKKKRIGITRIHMEEDAGKLVHKGTIETTEASYVDFNRSSVPLIEIVSEPDIRSPKEAAEYLKELRTLLQYLEICDGNMEEGSLRCDANVSVRPKGSKKFGTRTEVKNLNSFRNVEHALDYEIKRQIEVIESGEEVVQETRLWDANNGKTLSMRGKEEAHDYRYFPDPDLVPLKIDKEWIEEVRKSLPELPDQKRERFVSQYGIPEYDAAILTATKALANYYEKTVAIFNEPKTVSNWIMSELLRELKRDDKDIEDILITPEKLAALLKLIKDGTISGKIAKEVFVQMYETGKEAREIVEERGLAQLSNEDELSNVIDEVLSSLPKEVEEYKKGKEKLFGFFIGQVMKRTKNRANPKLVNEILKKKLKG